MSTALEKIVAISEVIEKFDSVFQNHPGMLGKPEEICAMFFYLDQIRHILQGESDFDDFDKSWIGFLIEKKLIVGAENRLLESIHAGNFGYEDLRKLRVEYFSWRRENKTL